MGEEDFAEEFQVLRDNPDATRWLLQLLEDTVSAFSNTPHISRDEAVISSFHNAMQLDANNPDAILEFILQRDPWVHPGLSRVCADVKEIPDYGIDGTREGIYPFYNFPTLWHAVHQQLFLVSIHRRDVVVDICQWCDGPMIRFPKRERKNERRFCSGACQRAANRS